jgi:carbamoylphosphate synthase large subunit
VSSSVAHFFEVPAAGDASFIPVMLKIVRDFKVGLLVPTVSEELPIFAREKSAFAAAGCQVMIASVHAVDVADDKLKTAQLLERHGIAVPRTLPGETAPAEVIESLGLPIIAKPRVSRGGRGVVLHITRETLLQEHRDKIIFQQFMSGAEYDANLFVDSRGVLQSCIVLHKTSLREGVTGNALTVERVQRDDIVDLCRRAVTALGFTGPADIDIREDALGKPHLLEINARFGANALSASEVLDDFMSGNKSSMQLFEGA